MQRTDAQIQQDVEDELLLDRMIHATCIGVNVRAGVATLTGAVDSDTVVRRIEAAARRIVGVRSLLLKLTTSASAPPARLDGDIERECHDVLHAVTNRSGDQIEVMVSNGTRSQRPDHGQSFMKHSLNELALDLLACPYDQLDERAKRVATHVPQRPYLTRDCVASTTGQRAADAVVRFGGA